MSVRWFFHINLSILFLIYCGGYAAVIGGNLSDMYSYGPSARMAAMGSGGRTIAEDATAAIWNPSLLGLRRNLNLSFSSTTLLADTTYTHAAVAMLFGQDVVAINVSSLQTSGVERHISSVTPNATPDGSFGQSQELYLISWAHPLSPGFLVGMTGRYNHRLLDTYEDQIFTADFGLTSVMGVFRAGLMLRNVLTYKTGDTQDDSGLSVELGCSAHILPEWLIAVDVDQLNKPNKNYYVGTEYEVIGTRQTGNALSFRAGSNGFENSIGLGLALSGFEIDYAYIMKSLENEHRFSVNFDFGDKL